MIFNINNMLTFFFYIFITVLSDEEGVVQKPKCSPICNHLPLKTYFWTVLLTVTTHKTSSSTQIEYYQREKELFLDK